MAFRAGYVALVGRPNVGKSTLMNRIVGEKVSIVSNKPQTTRKRVVGITTSDAYQIAFMDTPGIHEPHTNLGKSMVDQAKGALTEVDVLVIVVDGAHHPGEADKTMGRFIKDEYAMSALPKLLCLNKMDLLKAEHVQRNVEAYQKLFDTEEFMLTTAVRGTNVDRLVAMIVEKLPERAPMYDADEFTDQSQRFMAAEFVREKILIATREEVPHATAVVVDEWIEEEGMTRIHATIHVEKASQRGILIGKQGQFLKKVGTEAREELEKLQGKKIFLELHVKVSEDWRMNPRMLREMDYES
jgi:GTP-binding protein Era